MSRKYLGTQFDIHGGGLDLMFPHHECEIAQSQASHNHSDAARFWMHNNLITINGKKMGKSLGNFITLGELFTGKHEVLQQAYSPMTIRFFILQAHYRSTLDFSNEGLQAARKGFLKVMNGLRILEQLQYPETAGEIDAKAEEEIKKQVAELFTSLNDDLNTAKVIAALFNLLKKINSMFTGGFKLETISQEVFEQMRTAYQTMVKDILGLKEEQTANAMDMLQLVLSFYKEAKEAKDYAKVDLIRAQLKGQGIVIKDMKTGIDWAYEE